MTSYDELRDLLDLEPTVPDIDVARHASVQLRALQASQKAMLERFADELEAERVIRRAARFRSAAALVVDL